MPTTNTNFTSLITAIDTKAQSLAASTTDPKDLVFLGKAVEALNVADTVSAVITEGDTQVAAVNTAGTTQVTAVTDEGTTQVAAVAAQGASYLEKSNNLSGLADPAIARLNIGFPSQFTNLSEGQGLIYDSVLSKWVNGDTILKAATRPPYNTGTYTLGTLWVNTTTGEIFVCTSVDTSVTPTTYIWEGTSGSVVGISRGERLFVNENYQGFADASYAQFTTSFVVPDSVTLISAVCVGGGGGGHPSWANAAGAGGALAWANDIPVTPGETLTLEIGNGGAVGNNGGNTNLKRGGTLIFGAEGGRYSGTSIGTIAEPLTGTVTPGNNSSGRGGLTSQNGYGGGGGAGGYSGNGGNGAYGTTYNTGNTFNQTGGGTGGAAGGGNGYGSSTYGFGGGGGVGLYGEGPSGPQLTNYQNNHSNDMVHSGRPGSGGEAGSRNHNSSGAPHGTTTANSDGYGYFGDWDNATKSFPNMSTDGTVQSTGTKTTVTQQGGHFGGGAGGGGTSNTNHSGGYTGGMGGARIIWGAGRSFPSTNVKLLSTLNLDGSEG